MNTEGLKQWQISDEGHPMGRTDNEKLLVIARMKET
jgi:hypothetical protein